MLKLQAIQLLRGKTNAGIKDCKTALEKSNYDIEKAIAILRTQGIQHTKSTKTTNAGTVTIFNNNTRATIVQLNSETDFVSKNEIFLTLAYNIAKAANISYRDNDIEYFQKHGFIDGDTIEHNINKVSSIVKEKICLQQIRQISVDHGSIHHYIHNKISPHSGSIITAIALGNNNQHPLTRQVAMHITAVAPIALHPSDINARILQQEEEIIRQTVDHSKPKELVNKIVAGKIDKFYCENVLSEQKWVIDGKTKVKKILDQMFEDDGTEILEFIRVETMQPVL